VRLGHGLLFLFKFACACDFHPLSTSLLDALAFAEPETRWTFSPLAALTSPHHGVRVYTPEAGRRSRRQRRDPFRRRNPSRALQLKNRTPSNGKHPPQRPSVLHRLPLFPTPAREEAQGGTHRRPSDGETDAAVVRLSFGPSLSPPGQRVGSPGRASSPRSRLIQTPGPLSDALFSERARGVIGRAASCARGSSFTDCGKLLSLVRPGCVICLVPFYSGSFLWESVAPLSLSLEVRAAACSKFYFESRGGEEKMLLSTAKNLTVKSIIWQRKLNFFLPCPLV